MNSQQNLQRANGIIPTSPVGCFTLLIFYPTVCIIRDRNNICVDINKSLSFPKKVTHR